MDQPAGVLRQQGWPGGWGGQAAGMARWLGWPGTWLGQAAGMASQLAGYYFYYYNYNSIPGCECEGSPPLLDLDWPGDIAGPVGRQTPL